DCVDQLRLWCDEQSTRIILICDQSEVANRAKYIPGLEIFHYDESNTSSHYKIQSRFGTGNVFHFSMSRFLALEQCMKALDIKQAIHIEHDNLIYAPLDWLMNYCRSRCQHRLGITPDAPQRAIGGFMFLGS